MYYTLLFFLVSPALFVPVATEQETETHHASFKTVTKNLHQHLLQKREVLILSLGWEFRFASLSWQLWNRSQALLEAKVVNATQALLTAQSSELSERTQALLDSRVQDLEVKVVNATQDMVDSFKIEVTETLEKNQREEHKPTKSSILKKVVNATQDMTAIAGITSGK